MNEHSKKESKFKVGDYVYLTERGRIYTSEYRNTIQKVEDIIELEPCPPCPSGIFTYYMEGIDELSWFESELEEVKKAERTGGNATVIHNNKEIINSVSFSEALQAAIGGYKIRPLKFQKGYVVWDEEACEFKVCGRDDLYPLHISDLRHIPEWETFKDPKYQVGQFVYNLSGDIAKVVNISMDGEGYIYGLNFNGTQPDKITLYREEGVGLA